MAEATEYLVASPPVSYEAKLPGTFGFAVAGGLLLHSGGLGFVLFVLQILGLLPPHLRLKQNR